MKNVFLPGLYRIHDGDGKVTLLAHYCVVFHFLYSISLLNSDTKQRCIELIPVTYIDITEEHH